jgi:ectoine hydroxylase-related dioxygenase (phytanoyl-CoA dioxygenase family)
MLSHEQVAFYRENGYLVVRDVFDGATLEAARRAIADYCEKAHGVTGHTELYDLEPSHRPDAPRVRRIKTPHVHSALFNGMAREKKLVAILKDLLGPAVRLHGSKINLKSPRYGSPVEWHQDWAFYPHTNDDILAVGVMLDDCALENGPLMVLPGTHRGPVWNHHDDDGYFCGAMDPNACALDFAKAVPLTAPAGSISLHHVRLVHGSAQNTSARPRQLLLYEFAAADAWPLVGVPDLAAFDGRIVAGEKTIEPRLAPAPVRMPLPPARNQGSIYENQTASRRRFFETKEEAPLAAV